MVHLPTKEEEEAFERYRLRIQKLYEKTEKEHEQREKERENYNRLIGKRNM